jgi:hypothetical protein
MIVATKGGDEDEDKIILCANPAVDFGQDLKMLARDKMMHGGEELVRKGFSARMVRMGDTVRRWVWRTAAAVGWGSAGRWRVNVVMVVMPLTPSPRAYALLKLWKGQRKRRS